LKNEKEGLGKRGRREEVSLLPTIQASRKLFSFIVGFYLAKRVQL
jgi:hypothetical protein